MQFASVNGLIIELVDRSHTRCFPVDWLSDYPNEKEHLFIQSSARMTIKNLFDPESGMDYVEILNALRIMDRNFNMEHGPKKKPPTFSAGDIANHMTEEPEIVTEST
eukprot:108659_1